MKRKSNVEKKMAQQKDMIEGWRQLAQDRAIEIEQLKRIFSSLLTDLKKRQLGREHRQITMERLDEASKAIDSIVIRAKAPNAGGQRP